MSNLTQAGLNDEVLNDGALNDAQKNAAELGEVADAVSAPLTNPEAGMGGAASFADAETREILNLLGESDAGGSCCGGSCCSV